MGKITNLRRQIKIDEKKENLQQLKKGKVKQRQLSAPSVPSNLDGFNGFYVPKYLKGLNRNHYSLANNLNKISGVDRKLFLDLYCRYNIVPVACLAKFARVREYDVITAGSNVYRGALLHRAAKIDIVELWPLVDGMSPVKGTGYQVVITNKRLSDYVIELLKKKKL